MPHKGVCSACRATPQKLLACGRCKQTQYCNADCQKLHWRDHKVACAETQKRLGIAFNRACGTGDIGALPGLLSQGADISYEIKDPLHPCNGAFPLSSASQAGHANVVDFLIKNKANVNQMGPILVTDNLTLTRSYVPPPLSSLRPQRGNMKSSRGTSRQGPTSTCIARKRVCMPYEAQQSTGIWRLLGSC